MPKTKACPSCETVLPGKARFCHACGCEQEDAPDSPPEKQPEFLTKAEFDEWRKDVEKRAADKGLFG